MSCENVSERFASELSTLAQSAARERMCALFDGGSFTELDRFTKNGDSPCEVIAGFGLVCGTQVYAYAQDSSVSSGAMGKVQSTKIKRVYELAAKTGCPIVAMFDSNGAHIDEGMDAMESYGELILAAGNLSGVVPQISLILGPCIGSAAILAAITDVTIMSKKAEFYVNSSVVASEFNTVDLAVKNGVAAIVSETDKDAIEKAVQLISYLPANNLTQAVAAEYVAPDLSECIISKIVDSNSFFELSAKFGECVKVGFARIAGCTVGIVKSETDNINNGRICGNGASKIARFIRFCDAFSIPIVTLLDCVGFLGKEDSEILGDVKSVAKLAGAYSEATTAKITIITGSAIGAVYSAMAGRASNVDMVLALPTAVISPLEPKTAVQFLYKDRLGDESRETLECEYKNTVASPFLAAAGGYIDDVVEENDLSTRIVTALDMLASKRVSTLDKKHANIQL